MIKKNRKRLLYLSVKNHRLSKNINGLRPRRKKRKKIMMTSSKTTIMGGEIGGADDDEFHGEGGAYKHYEGLNTNALGWDKERV